MEENFIERFHANPAFFELKAHEIKKIISVNKDIGEVNPLLLETLTKFYSHLVKSFVYAKALTSQNYMEEIGKIDFMSKDSIYGEFVAKVNALYAYRNHKDLKLKLDKFPSDKPPEILPASPTPKKKTFNAPSKKVFVKKPVTPVKDEGKKIPVKIKKKVVIKKVADSNT